MTFEQLAIGQEFDWIDPNNPSRNSFFHRCVKVSARKYKAIGDCGDAMKGFSAYVVGSVKAEVFNVKES